MQLSYVKVKFCYASHSIFFTTKLCLIYTVIQISNRSDDGDIQARID